MKTAFLHVKTGFRIAEVEGVFDHICESTIPTEQVQAEIAQALNGGSFDSESYHVPCFDVDGFITYPVSSIELNYETFNILSKHISTHQHSDESSLSQEVINFIYHSKVSQCERIENGLKNKCEDVFNCCSCGTGNCGCHHCWDCNACQYCKNDE